MEDKGYVYCFSNASMPGLLKVGMTLRTPAERLDEANSSTWVPTAFMCEFAKFVTNPIQKEQNLHNLLGHFTTRVNKKREFFKVSVDEVKALFDLTDGEYYTSIKSADKNIDNVGVVGIVNADEAADMSDDSESKPKYTYKYCRVMPKCFYDGQRIRHVIKGIGKIKIGFYSKNENVIITGDSKFKSLSTFAESHYKSEKPDRKTSSANGWAECECEILTEESPRWISTYKLHPFE